MRTVKKAVAALLVLTMVLALAGTAMADGKLEGNMVEFKRDSAAYTDHKSGKQTKNVAQKGSWAMCEKVCGKYARLLVNAAGKGVYCWFKTSDLKLYKGNYTWIRVVWARGGRGMSHYEEGSVSDPLPALKHKKLKVIGHTHLRKHCGLDSKSRGVVRKGDRLKMTGRVGEDDRAIGWLEVWYKGKKRWISQYFVELTKEQWESFYNRLHPTGAY